MESKLFAGALIVAIIIMAGGNYIQWKTVQMTAGVVVALQEQLTACKQ